MTATVLRLVVRPDPDECTPDEALRSGLGIYAAGALPPGVEESDLGGVYDEPAKVVTIRPS